MNNIYFKIKFSFVFAAVSLYSNSSSAEKYCKEDIGEQIILNRAKNTYQYIDDKNNMNLKGKFFVRYNRKLVFDTPPLSNYGEAFYDYKAGTLTFIYRERFGVRDIKVVFYSSKCVFSMKNGD